MKLKCVVLDDEPLALKLICDYISKLDSLELVFSSNKPIEMYQYIINNEVHLAFFDIQMPEIIGTDLFKMIKGKCEVIFITAYDHYAVEGFNLNAVDYLLKPVSFSRFLTAVDRVIQKYQNNSPVLNQKPEDDSNKFIFIKSENSLIKVKFETLKYIQGYGDYIKIYAESSSPILSLTSLKQMEELLPASEFFRVHKSYIVNINYIDQIQKNTILISGIEIPISETYKEDLLKKLSIKPGF